MHRSFVVILSLMLLVSCASLTLEGVDFAWPVESVQTVSKDNRVEERRYSLVINVGPLAEMEFGDQGALSGKTLHMIRGVSGHYFVTAAGFKNVYVFESGTGTLDLSVTLMVSEQGLSNPAFNQRSPHIELADGNRKILMTHEELVEKEDQ